MDQKVYIHVGLFKTATTYLQKQVFPNIDGIDYFTIHKPFQEYIWTINQKAPFQPSSFDPTNLNTFSQKILISREDLLGSPFHNYINAHHTLTELKQNFPESKILLTIRKQDDLIESLYRQHIQAGGVQSVRKFINYDRYSNSYKPYTFKHGINLDIHSLNYLDIYNYLSHVFGQENVTLIPYELIKDDKELFLEKLATFLDEDSLNISISAKSSSNRSISKLSISLARVLNRLFKIKSNSGFGLIPQTPFREYLLRHYKKNKVLGLLLLLSSKITVRNILQNGLDKFIYVKGDCLKEKYRNGIMNQHAASNQKLDDLLGLHLKKYKYY
ncbi:MAG: hypothetical protein AAFY71_02955 [Bacteroidota bacterium]